MNVCGGGGCCCSVYYTDRNMWVRDATPLRYKHSFIFLPYMYIRWLTKQRETVLVFAFASNMWSFGHVEICMSSIAAGVSAEGVLFLSLSLTVY